MNPKAYTILGLALLFRKAEKNSEDYLEIKKELIRRQNELFELHRLEERQ